jgi:chitinase
VTKYQFDGVDIDWEYPVSGGEPHNHNRPEDGSNYVLLLKELRNQLNQLSAEHNGKQYFLTVASPAGEDNFRTFKLGEMATYLDWFNLMTYDYHGDWESTTNHQAALYANPIDPSDLAKKYIIDYTINAYIKAGVPSKKIVLGVPQYCRGWKGVQETNHGLFQRAKGAASGTFDVGQFDYYDLFKRIKQNPDAYRVYWDEAAQVPYVYAASVEGGMFATYESPRSIGVKANYIKAKNLGGMMFWDASNDVRDANSADSLTGSAWKALNN